MKKDKFGPFGPDSIAPTLRDYKSAILTIERFFAKSRRRSKKPLNIDLKHDPRGFVGECRISASDLPGAPFVILFQRPVLTVATATEFGWDSRWRCGLVDPQQGIRNLAGNRRIVEAAILVGHQAARKVDSPFFMGELEAGKEETP